MKKYKVAGLIVFYTLLPIAILVKAALTKQYLVGFLWLIFYAATQFLALQERKKRHREDEESNRIIEDLRLNYPWITDAAEEGRLVQSPKVSEQCSRCKFFYGHFNIVCAVHPNGWKDTSCFDWQPK
jgi:hypothetical protein